jgi:acyl dehydratase
MRGPVVTLADQRRVDFACRFTQQDFNRFADLSGDDNPIHVDPVFAARTRFKKPVAHGMLLYGVICKAIGALFPQRPVLPLRQELLFANPTPVDTDIRVQAWVAQEQGQAHTAEIAAAIELPDGLSACTARCVVRLADQQPGYGPPEALSENPPACEAKTYRHLSIGQKASIKKAFTDDDRREYASLTGDANPLWSDGKSARQAGFRDAIIPGPLLSALFSRLLGTHLPGRGTNWLKQKLQFLAPVCWNDELTATVELVRLRPEKHLANLDGMCADSQGTPVCRAQSLVLVKDLEG